MTEIVKIAHNAVSAKLIDASRQVKLEVQQILSYAVAGADKMSRFQSSGWDGRSSFLHFNEGLFPRGFVHLVYHRLQQRGYKVQIVRKSYPEPLGVANPKVDDFGEDPRYDYQPEIVNRLLAHGQMIAQVATGGGKSRIAKLCAARIRRPTLFLTTRSILMYQMASSFKYLTNKVGILGDSVWEPAAWINCGMVQTFVANLKNPKMRDETIRLLERFEFVIGEEAHEVSGDGYTEILKHCKNAHYRIALTATPFMKDDEEANMRLMASFGTVGITVSEKMLIDRGILARPYFKFIKLPEHTKPEKLFRTTPWQRATELGIVNYVYRNKCIAAEAIRATRWGLTTMVLVSRKDHGKVLLDMFKKNGIRAEFIFGENKQAERQRAIAKMKNGQLDVLIGSTILDVGVDVPAIGMVILAGGGKAEVALRQRIGRGLREKKNGLPNIAFIVDFEDSHNVHLKGHAKARRAIIESTPGFAENIVKDDFDFTSLGLQRHAA